MYLRFTPFVRITHTVTFVRLHAVLAVLGFPRFVRAPRTYPSSVQFIQFCTLPAGYCTPRCCLPPPAWVGYTLPYLRLLRFRGWFAARTRTFSTTVLLILANHYSSPHVGCRILVPAHTRRLVYGYSTTATSLRFAVLRLYWFTVWFAVVHLPFGCRLHCHARLRCPFALHYYCGSLFRRTPAPRGCVVAYARVAFAVTFTCVYAPRGCCCGWVRTTRTRSLPVYWLTVYTACRLPVLHTRLLHTCLRLRFTYVTLPLRLLRLGLRFTTRLLRLPLPFTRLYVLRLWLVACGHTTLRCCGCRGSSLRFTAVGYTHYCAVRFTFITVTAPAFTFGYRCRGCTRLFCRLPHLRRTTTACLRYGYRCRRTPFVWITGLVVGCWLPVTHRFPHAAFWLRIAVGLLHRLPLFCLRLRLCTFYTSCVFTRFIHACLYWLVLTGCGFMPPVCYFSTPPVACRFCVVPLRLGSTRCSGCSWVRFTVLRVYARGSLTFCYTRLHTVTWFYTHVTARLRCYVYLVYTLPLRHFVYAIRAPRSRLPRTFAVAVAVILFLGLPHVCTVRVTRFTLHTRLPHVLRVTFVPFTVVRLRFPVAFGFWLLVHYLLRILFWFVLCRFVLTAFGLFAGCTCRSATLHAVTHTPAVLTTVATLRLVCVTHVPSPFTGYVLVWILHATLPGYGYRFIWFTVAFVVWFAHVLRTRLRTHARYVPHAFSYLYGYGLVDYTHTLRTFGLQVIAWFCLYV